MNNVLKVVKTSQGNSPGCCFVAFISIPRCCNKRKGSKDMSKKKGQKKKPTCDETSEKIAKYCDDWSLELSSLRTYKQLGRIVLTLIKHK